jgi:hypothetical protein
MNLDASLPVSVFDLSSSFANARTSFRMRVSRSTPLALTEMGVPGEWCNKRVVQGKFLISVRCSSWQEFFQAIGVLKFTESVDTSWSVSLDEYRVSRTRSKKPGERRAGA